MSKPAERVRALIEEARNSVARRDNAPSVVNHMLNVGWLQIVEDEDLLRSLVARGLSASVREVLTRHHGAEDGAPPRAHQLAMWPERQRGFVKDINRERVFVPSRADFVELVPDALTVSEIREAGLYLVSHGVSAAAKLTHPPVET